MYIIYSASRYVLSLRSLSTFNHTQSILAQLVNLHPEIQGRDSFESCVNLSHFMQHASTQELSFLVSVDAFLSGRDRISHPYETTNISFCTASLYDFRWQWGRQNKRTVVLYLKHDGDRTNVFLDTPWWRVCSSIFCLRLASHVRYWKFRWPCNARIFNKLWAPRLFSKSRTNLRKHCKFPSH